MENTMLKAFKDWPLLATAAAILSITAVLLVAQAVCAASPN
jgi:hypothetical protein